MLYFGGRILNEAEDEVMVLAYQPLAHEGVTVDVIRTWAMREFEDLEMKFFHETTCFEDFAYVCTEAPINVNFMHQGNN